MKEKAPIIIFTYNRLDHTSRVINSLLKNKEVIKSKLIIYSDGPKNSRDESGVNEVISYIKNIKGFQSVELILNNNNQGLANSIIKGVTETLEKYGKCIVLEDDIVVSPFFLEYMNTALETYENDNQVMQISAYSYPIEDISENDTFFLDRITSWGWGTWKRAWNDFDTDPAKLIEELKKNNKVYKFNMNDNFNFMSSLEANANNLIHTWAIKWQANVTLKDGIVLFPKNSLVDNIGLDGSGVNSGKNTDLKPNMYGGKIEVSKFDIMEVDESAQEKVSRYYRSIRPSILTKVINKIKLWLKK